MNNQPFVRVLLWMLGGVTLLLLYRVFSGPPGRNGLMVIENIDVGELEHRSMDVERRIQVSISGVGSYEDDETASSELAAYGWILDRGSRDVVWSMDRARTMNRGRGLTVEVSDSVMLEEGEYEVFFTSYGNQPNERSRRSFLESIRGNHDWRNDARFWHLVLNVVDGKPTDARVVHRDEEDVQRIPGQVALWSSGPVGSRSVRQYLFEVKDETKVRIRTTGEITADANDTGQLENAINGEIVWEMTQSNSMPAGGLEQNRRAESDIDLKPGIYLASYQTDASHAYRDWRGNPPFDPYSWGLSLSLSQSTDAISAFDPWSERAPIVAMMEVRNDEIHSATFTISRPMHVMIDAIGEIKQNDRYDFAWIERSTGRREEDFDEDNFRPDSETTIWEMRYDDSDPAGGGASNRRVIAFLELSPDTYTLFYRTDDSHAFEDWRNGEPDHGERWGAALFALDSQVDAFHIVDQIDLNYGDGEEWAPEPPPLPAIAAPTDVVAPSVPIPVDERLVLISMNRLGNNENRKATLKVEEDTPLRIIAAGEISLSGNQYDFGTIERAGTGEKVWELTRENSHPGSGDDANRFFDGVVEFKAGEYIVRFQTDGTHAFGHFDSGKPAMPDAWGITIARVH